MPDKPRKFSTKKACNHDVMAEYVSKQKDRIGEERDRLSNRERDGTVRGDSERR